MTTRRPRAALAAIAGLVSPGLGYLYVGRARLALAAPLLLVGIVALAGWTRIVMQPWGFYAAGALLVLLSLAYIAHPAMIAYKLEALPARSFNRGWVYLLWILTIAFASYHTGENRGTLFGFEPFRVPASSMAPTIQKNDRIMVDTWYFERHTPALDDLVVFGVPDNPEMMYVKRIVGLPGDTLELRGDVLFRNGQAVAEHFVQLSAPWSGAMSDFEAVDIPDDHYFVLGDNRHYSRDSRFIGPIHRDLLHGRVEYRWFAYADGVSWSQFPATLNDDRE